MPEITVIPARNRSGDIIRSAAYARVSSSSDDQLNSFNAQIRYYTELLSNSTNTVFVDMYADEGITGTSAAKRDEFQRLMSDCRKGKIDRILTKSVSRFARNTKDCLEAVRELKSLGVSVYFEKEKIDTGELSSEMLLTLYSQFAQEESLSISRNCRMGIHKRMADGSYKNASVPYGYVYDNGQITIDESKAQVIRRIFTEYAAGKGAAEIADGLNKDNTKPPITDKWYSQVIAKIIANERYIGDSLLQKRYTTESLPFQRRYNHGEREQFYIVGSHPPIIDRELFETVQKLRSVKNEKYYRKCTGQTYPLSRKIKCSCGSTFRRKMVNGTVRWTCIRHDQHSSSACAVKPISEATIYQAFTRMTAKLSDTCRDILIPMQRQLRALYDSEIADNQQVAALRKEISDIKEQCHLMTKLQTQGVLDAEYFTTRSQELERQITALQKQLHTMLSDDDSAQADELNRLITTIENADADGSFNEVLFGQIVRRIYVRSETELEFELPGGVSFCEKIERKGR
ncbi:MAG: recombinase family protein [Oscillospiraceae bacterium]